MGGDFFKVWGAALIALTVALAIGIGINEVTHSDHLDIKAYAVAVPDSGESPAAEPKEEVLDPVAPLLASADIGAGEKAFKRCSACHSYEKGGPNKQGPNLYGVVGNPVGTHDGFSYSDSMKDLGGEWTYDKLNAFLAKPKDLVADTKMNFVGFKSVKDRANVIAFLRAQADNLAPLPAQ